MEIMRKTILAISTSLLFVAAGAFAVETQADLQKEAKISMSKAKSIALKKVPHGVVQSSELERENKKLIYSFDVKNNSGITEVNVDALNGKVVDVHHESPAKEAAEKKADQKQH